MGWNINAIVNSDNAGWWQMVCLYTLLADLFGHGLDLGEVRCQQPVREAVLALTEEPHVPTTGNQNTASTELCNRPSPEIGSLVKRMRNLNVVIVNNSS